MITITEAAQLELDRIVHEEVAEQDRRPGMGVRIGIKGGGCSGFSYIMKFESQAREFDTVFNEDRVPIYIDAKSLMYLDEIEIDYESDLLNRGFKFNNPNAAKTCGCGTSFAV